MKKVKLSRDIFPKEMFDVFSEKKSKRKRKETVTKKNIKILKSGKVKFKKDQKISLDPYIKDSVKGCVCSRIEGIPNNEEVVLEETNLKTEINTNLTSIKRCLELNAYTSDQPYTVVSVCSKKEAEGLFDFMENTIIGVLLRTSTLASIYKTQKERWVELNTDDKTAFTNVLYIPNILIFLNERDGKILKKPFKVNLLVVSVPNAKCMVDGIAEAEDDVVVKRIVDDIFESAIKIHTPKLIISPFCYHPLLKDEHLTSEYWHAVSETERVNNNIKSIDFCVNSDDSFIIFKKSKKSE